MENTNDMEKVNVLNDPDGVITLDNIKSPAVTAKIDENVAEKSNYNLLGNYAYMTALTQDMLENSSITTKSILTLTEVVHNSKDNVNDLLENVIMDQVIKYASISRALMHRICIEGDQVMPEGESLPTMMKVDNHLMKTVKMWQQLKNPVNQVNISASGAQINVGVAQKITGNSGSKTNDYITPSDEVVPEENNTAPEHTPELF